MGPHLYGLLPLLLLLLGLGSSQPITLTPTTPRVVGKLIPFTFLECEFGPSNAMVDVGWRLPSGEFLTPVNDTEDIHISDVGDLAQADNTTRDVFIVTIFAMSHQHAGIYSCEVRDTATPGAGWITAEVDLQLRVNLATNASTQVTVNDSDNEVQLSCEMTLFIREDEDLQWFKDDQLIRSGTDRYTVTYRDGTPSASQKGGTRFVSGRVAVLTISNPEEDDSGTYSCAVAGTDQSIDFQLSVVSVDDDGGKSTNLGAIIGGVVGALFVSVLILTAVAAATRCLVRQHPKDHICDNIDPIEPGFKSANHANAACTTQLQSATPQYSNNTPTRGDLEGSSCSDQCYKGQIDQKRSPSTEHAGAVSPQTTTSKYTMQNLSESEVGIQHGRSSHVNPPIRADLQGSRLGYSNPRYHSEVEQQRGSSPHCTESQTTIIDENGYTLPDLCGSDAVAPHIIAPTRADLESGGYCDPRYHGEVDLNKGSLSDDYTQQDLSDGNAATQHGRSRHINTPPRADLEGGGYSNPCYNGEVDQKGGSLTGHTVPQTTSTDRNGYTQPDLFGSNAAAHASTPTWADMEGGGYCDPRYHGEVDQDGGSLTEQTDPQTTTTDQNGYTQPDLSGSNAVAHARTLTRADMEGGGYCDPRYHGEVDLNKGSLSDDSTRTDLYSSNAATQHGRSRHINTPPRADMEGGGYSNPCYNGEVDQEGGSLTGHTDPQTTITDRNGYTQPDLSGSNAAAHASTPTRADMEGGGYCDPRYHGEVDLNKGSLSDDSTQTDLHSSNVATQSNIPTRTDLKGGGYSDPRYYGSERHAAKRSTTIETEV